LETTLFVMANVLTSLTTNGCGEIPVPVVGTTVSGCCCNGPMCNDPSNGPITSPNPNPTFRKCFTGISLPRTNYVFGDYIICDGQCANISATLGAGNTRVNLYTCDPVDVCVRLGIGNTWYVFGVI